MGRKGWCAGAQGRALLKKLEASSDWGQIMAISRHPDPDLAGTRVQFLPLDLLDSEVRPFLSWVASMGALLQGAPCWARMTAHPASCPSTARRNLLASALVIPPLLCLSTLIGVETRVLGTPCRHARHAIQRAAYTFAEPLVDSKAQALCLLDPHPLFACDPKSDCMFCHALLLGVSIKWTFWTARHSCCALTQHAFSEKLNIGMVECTRKRLYLGHQTFRRHAVVCSEKQRLVPMRCHGSQYICDTQHKHSVSELEILSTFGAGNQGQAKERRLARHACIPCCFLGCGRVAAALTCMSVLVIRKQQCNCTEC